MAFLLFVALLVIWLLLEKRIAALHDKLARLAEQNLDLEAQVRELTRRVFHLERPTQVRQLPEAPAVAIAEPQIVAPEPVIVAPEIPAPEPPSPVETAPSRVDWEAVVGGSWLNALGMLVLVVGISLFLGYALTQFGPAGKVAIGAAAATAMLLGGAILERRGRYEVFGRGLLAGGWATLYFTAYAMYALPAARIVHSPIIAGVALLSVAGGMIAHSLLYRSQGLTLLAYTAAFLALQLSAWSPLAVAASVPLAASLLMVSYRLDWTNCPLAGMAFTYWTFAFRYDARELGAAVGVASLYCYWAAFETYDLWKLRAGRLRTLQDAGLLPLNAVFFVVTAMLTLPASSPVQSSNFLASAGAMLLASGWLRRRWSGRTDVLGSVPQELIVLQQGFRIAIGFAAALFAGALLRRFPPLRAEIGLLFEGQLLVLAGLRLPDRFLCRLADAVLAVAVGHLLLAGTRAGEWTLAGWHVDKWAAVALLMAVTFFWNRKLIRGGPHYTWAASALLACAATAVLHDERVTAVWFLLALGLSEVHLRTRLTEFRYQALALGGLATLYCLVNSGGVRPQMKLRAAALDAWGAAAAYLGAWRALPPAVSAAGTLLAAYSSWLALPAPLVVLAWGLLAVVLLEAGWHRPQLRWQAHVLGAMSVLRLFLVNLAISGDTYGLSHRLLTSIPVILFTSTTWWRLHARADLSAADRLAARGYCWASTAMLVALLRFELGRTLTVLGWAALMLALVRWGVRRGLPDLRYQGYVLAALVFARAWATNFASPEQGLGLGVRLAIATVVVASFHAAQFRLPGESRRIRPAFAVLGVILLSTLLFHEVSGRMLTICLGAQAVCTLLAGFLARERILRLAGLGLFLVCVLKLFFHDLRNLDTVSRILSFIVLGLVLMGASWLYMRFREKIQRYL